MRKALSKILRQRAEHYRQLAREIVDMVAQHELHGLADDYEARAAAIENAGPGEECGSDIQQKTLFEPLSTGQQGLDLPT